MGESEIRAAEPWGLLACKLLEHRIVLLLLRGDLDALSKASAIAVLYDHMRSFMALKSRLKSSEPESDALLPAHDALVSLTSRLFMTANQTLLNGFREEGEVELIPRRVKGKHREFVTARRFLLQWQLVRLGAARERFVLELADLSEKDEQLFLSLGLPEALTAEVECARLRVSMAWKGLPILDWEYPVLGGVRRQAAA